MGHMRYCAARTAYSRRVQYRVLRGMLVSLALVLVAVLVFELLGA
jgi:hypothetical protein